MFAFQDSSEKFQPVLPGKVCCDIWYSVSALWGEQPVFLRGFLCPESLKVTLTVKLKSALSGTPSVPPNRAAQGCQRYYTALLKPAVRWKYCPRVHDFVAVKKRYDYQILLYHLMHSSVERENPIQGSVDQEILAKVFVGGKTES